MPELERRDDVFVLDLGDDENRFHPDWVAAIGDALDEVRSAEGPKALVVTARGKIWSNGLDLDWAAEHRDRWQDYIVDVQRLYARLLELPLITVAAIQGHAFAAGAMLTLVQDLRVMRADRGFWCLPEVDIDIPFTPGMSALVQARLAPQVAHEAMLTSRRYGGVDALAAGIVDRAVAEDEVLDTAIALAAGHVSRAGATLGAVKSRMYGPTLAALRDTAHPLG